MGTATVDASAPEMEWDELAPGGEISATVIMAAGFVLGSGQRVRERYRIEHALGEGAMGQVLAVTLIGSSDTQKYALKVVARSTDEGLNAAEREEAELQANSFAELLRQEAAKQDVAQRHGVPVARLFALVRLDDGSIGLRMELARGKSLEERIEDNKKRKESEPDVLGSVITIRKLVSQLRRLHEMKDAGNPFGFIHSDIKPGNVFVDDSDPSDVLVTLLDFGVATAGQALVQNLAVSKGNRKTFVMQQTGGTLGYAPPYHFTGKATPLSDVYAAIVILYELITLDIPWSFDDIAQSADNILMIEAEMISGPRPVRDVRPSVAKETAEILDAFFVREFGALHELAESGSQALSIEDEDVQRAMTERLSRLARDYQAKLDQLRAQLSPSRRPAALHQPASAVQGAPNVSTGSGIPKPAKVPTIPGFDPMLGVEVVSANPSANHPPMFIGRSTRPPPPQRAVWPWVLMVFVLAGAAAAFYKFRLSVTETAATAAPTSGGTLPPPMRLTLPSPAPAVQNTVTDAGNTTINVNNTDRRPGRARQRNGRTTQETPNGNAPNANPSATPTENSNGAATQSPEENQGSPSTAPPTTTPTPEPQPEQHVPEGTTVIRESDDESTPPMVLPHPPTN